MDDVARVLSRDEGLAILNDHIGEHVEVTTYARADDHALPVLAVTGTLRHWTARMPPEFVAVASGSDESRAMYLLADDDLDATAGRLSTPLLDLTDAADLRAHAVPLAHDDEQYGIGFMFGTGTVVEVIWGDDTRGARGASDG